MKSTLGKKNTREIMPLTAFIKQGNSRICIGSSLGGGTFCAASVAPSKSGAKKGAKRTWKEKLILLASGAVIGTLNGFFGGGGGMVCVPILEKVLKLDNKHAHATAIAVIMPLSLISAFIYVFNGYIQTFPLLVVGGGVVVGGILGSFILKFLPPKAVRIIFAIIMFAGGIKLIL